MNQQIGKALNGKRFIIIGFFFIALLCTLASINEIRLESFLEFGKCALSAKTLDPPTQNFNLAENSSIISNTSSNSPSSSDDEIRVLIGILTLPDHYHKRHFLRLIYGSQLTENAKVDVKFIFCNLTKDEQRVMVALEIMRFDDIIILNCTENMNSGKTYTYFSSLPEMLDGTNNTDGEVSPPYHYVMKADDDTYFRLQNLVQALRPLSREDLYFGFVIPCSSMDPFKHYMAGMGYLVSWDTVEWIRESDIPANHLQGPEDKVFGEWLRDGRRGKNRYNAKWSMYNFPQPPTGCTHEFLPDTIAVHNLKTPEKWIQTLNYFNVTLNLKPSKLYHIP